MLEQNVVHLGQSKHVSIVVIHEVLYCRLARRIFEAKALGQLTLPGKIQLVHVAARQQVQPKADPEKKVPALHQPRVFLGRQHAKRH